MQQRVIERAHALGQRGAINIPVELSLNPLQPRPGQGALRGQQIKYGTDASLVATERNTRRLLGAGHQIVRHLQALCRRRQALVGTPDIQRDLVLQPVALRGANFGLRRRRTHAISRIEAGKNRHIEGQAQRAAVAARTRRRLPARPGRQTQGRPTLCPRQLDAGLGRFQLSFCRLQIRTPAGRFRDQRIDILLEFILLRHGGQIGEVQRLLRGKTHRIDQRPLRVACIALGADTIERGLRQGRLRLQTIRRRTGAHLITAFRRGKTLARRPLGLNGGNHRRPRRLRGVIGLQGRKEKRLHRGVLAGCRRPEQLPGVLDIRRTLAEIEEQPGKRQRRAALVVIARFGIVARSRNPGIDIRQPGRLRHPDQRRLNPRRRPHLTGLRVVAQRQINGIERRQRGRGNLRRTRCLAHPRRQLRRRPQRRHAVGGKRIIQPARPNRRSQTTTQGKKANRRNRHSG